jgi:hypothetical protein
VAVGGQFIENATNVTFSGEGIRATLVDFNKPMPQPVFNKLRDRMRELQDKRQAAQKAGRKDTQPASTNVWTSAEEKELNEIRARIAKNPPNRTATPAIAEVATLKVIIEPNAAPGDREIRLGMPGAFSNPIKFRVGQLAEFSKPAAKAPNPEFDKFRDRTGTPKPKEPARSETRVTPPTLINGQIMPGLVDRYRFTARRGQQFVILASARELIPYIADAVPGWFQAALTLYDAKGHEVAYNDDFRFRPDPVLLCTIPADGEYVLEVKDAIYRGREDFVYRITLGELPFVTGIYPLGGQTGRDIEIAVTGWNLPTNKTTFSTRDRAPGIYGVSVATGETNSNSAAFAVDELPDTTEREPNNTGRNANPVQLPLIINGRIEMPGDEDVFKVTGRAGETLIAEITARRLDSPLDSALRLTDGAGKQIAINDDHEDKASGLNTHHADSYLRATLPADGTYFVHLGDTQGKGGPEYAYRLRLGAPQPDFALRLVPSAVNLRAGSSATVTVFALRQDGFTNAITLALNDPPRGFVLGGAIIPENQDQIRLTITSPYNPPEKDIHLDIEGRAAVAGRALVRPAVPADDMMQAFAYRHLVPAQEMKIALVSRNPGMSAKVLSPTPVKIPAGGTANLRLSLPYSKKGDRLYYELNEPPEGISIQSQTHTETGAEIVLKCDQAKPGVRGNLIINILPNRGEPSEKNKPAKTGRSFKLGTAPAIPFEIVAGELNAKAPSGKDAKN